MVDFIPQFSPQVRLKDIDAVQQQMLSGWVGPAKTTVAMEDKIKQLTGAKHCISTTSGTTAIMLALQGLNLPKGCTILFPAYTFLAGANACRMLGYKVQLVDIKLQTLCMSPTLVEHALEERDIACVMFVNHNGYVGEDVCVIKSLCDKYQVPMFEDSSQALGMPMAGRTGKVGVFSFSVPKLITTGQGGVVITDDDDVADICLAVRDHGNNWRATKIHERIGGNFKFNDILAAYGLSQLQNMDQLLTQRKVVFDRYRSYLKIYDYGYDSTWMVLYDSDRAKDVIAALVAEDIQATQYYRPVNHNPPYKTGDNYPAAEYISNRVIYLPSSLSLTQEQIDKICQIVVGTEGGVQ